MPYAPEAGDLVWTDFDPRLGREQSGRRPALVVSPADFCRVTEFAIVCPVTSRVRPFGTSVVLPSGLPVSGEILTATCAASTRWPIRSAMGEPRFPPQPS